MKTKIPLVLASNSPRRQQLLRNLGFEFEVVVRDVEEIIPEYMHPRAVAVLIAENKAKAYDDLSQDHLIITADTVVVLDDQILGKPEDEVAAVEMLRSLSGRDHTVISGVCFFHRGRFKSFAEATKVHFRDLNADEIRYYIETFKPFDKAGGYGIQDWIGMVGITGIEGDYYNVMGLPLASFYREIHTYLEEVPVS